MFRSFDPDNGLNQLLTVNGTAAAYDDRGNMTTDPVTGKTYSYLPSNNQLYNIPTPFATFGYDALDRLADVNNGGTVRNYVTDGTNIVAEYNASNVLQKRYAFDGSGWPLVAYDASGNRSWMLSDERGSIVALANDSAAMTAINTYDEYGIPGASNQGTLQYAGMMWLVRPGVYAPTYRAYNQLSGRFNQTDPIGFSGGINFYNYTDNDPVNLVDPLGLQAGSPPCNGSSAPNCNIIVVHCQNGGIAVQVGVGTYECIAPEQDLGIDRRVGEVDRNGGNRRGDGRRENGKQEQPKSKTSCSVSEEDSATTGATLGSGVVLPEYANLAIQLARRTAIRSIVTTAGAEAARGALAVLGGPVTIGAIAVGVGVYAYDRYSGGNITKFLNRQLGQLNLRIGQGCK